MEGGDKYFFEQEVTPTHHEWLSQGVEGAGLDVHFSKTEFFPPLSMKMEEKDFSLKLIESLKQYGFAVITDVVEFGEESPMKAIATAQSFFSMPFHEKQRLVQPPQPVPSLYIAPLSGTVDAKRDPSPTFKPDAPPAPENRGVSKRSPSPTHGLFRPTSNSFHTQPVMKTASGYGPYGREALNPYQPPDLKETFDYGLDLEEFGKGRTLIGFNNYPQQLKPSCERYIGCGVKVSRRLLHAIAIGLGLEFNAFDEHFVTPLAIQRFIRYPPQQIAEPLSRRLLHAIAIGLGLEFNAFDEHFVTPLAIQRFIRYPPQQIAEPLSRGGNVAIGAGSHIDYGGLTLLAQSSPGLEVQMKDKSWFAIQTRPNDLVVNVGFMLEKLTHGVLQATQHRVVNLNSADRYSTALFFDPNPNAKIVPSERLAKDSMTKKDYKECLAGHKGVKYNIHGYKRGN